MERERGKKERYEGRQQAYGNGERGERGKWEGVKGKESYGNGERGERGKWEGAKGKE